MTESSSGAQGGTGSPSDAVLRGVGHDRARTFVPLFGSAPGRTLAVGERRAEGPPRGPAGGADGSVDRGDRREGGAPYESARGSARLREQHAGHVGPPRQE